MFDIVTLCGSTRFKKEFEEIEKQLTLRSYIVLTVGFFEKIEGIELSSTDIIQLNALHMEKIRLSGSIFVINKDGYIGDQTRQEIEYAKGLGIKVDYLEAIE